MNESVAITTMHAVLNYGSILQTFALFIYIRELGYSPFIVDYVFPNEYHLSLQKKKELQSGESRFRNHINGICHRILKSDISNKVNKFRSFMDNMKLSERIQSEADIIKNPPLADIYVTGSDQVWNYDYIGEDDTFFLHWVPEAKKNAKLSYGSSFGGCMISSNFSKRIKPLLHEFSSISVRERVDVFADLRISATQVLDPIFLLNKNQWKELISDQPLVKGKYILCYLLGYSFDPFPYAYDVVRKVEKDTGFKVVMIGGEPLNILKGYQVFNDCGPIDFLNLFYYSSYVISSSFHGTAFAINFEKPFISIVDEQLIEDKRQYNIINQVGLGEEVILRKNTPLKNIVLFNKGECVAPNLENERYLSRHYLENSLKKLENS